MFFESMRLWMKLASFETPPIDLFPILKYVPERWASWKTLAKRTRELQHDIYFRMLGQAERRLSEGASKGNDCFIERCLQNQEALGMNREFVAYVACCPPPSPRAHRHIDLIQAPGRRLPGSWCRNDLSSRPLRPSLSRRIPRRAEKMPRRNRPRHRKFSITCCHRLRAPSVYPSLRQRGTLV